jgi:hypothetical protein
MMPIFTWTPFHAATETFQTASQQLGYGQTRAADSRQSGCARVLSWPRRSFVQEFVGQVGGGMDIAQRWDDLFPHEPDRAHQLVVLDPTKYHPVTDVGGTDTGSALELGDDRGRAAKEEPVHSNSR